MCIQFREEHLVQKLRRFRGRFAALLNELLQVSGQATTLPHSPDGPSEVGSLNMDGHEFEGVHGECLLFPRESYRWMPGTNFFQTVMVS